MVQVTGLDPDDPTLPSVLPVEVTVFGFALPTSPALLTAFNLDESILAKVYDANASAPKVSLPAIEKMWSAGPQSLGGQLRAESVPPPEGVGRGATTLWFRRTDRAPRLTPASEPRWDATGCSNPFSARPAEIRA